MTTTRLDLEKIPRHISIIMDGNGRWAKAKKMPRALGHRAGVESLKNIVQTAGDIGIEYLSLFAFSTENWSRPEQEVSALMMLLKEFLRKEAMRLHKSNVKIMTIGNIEKFPEDIVNEINEVKELTKHNSKLHLIIALNYGGRDELIRAIKKIMSENNSSDDINEELIQSHLDTKDIPDPDLLIRTSGEYRISNFMLWQTAYTEFWFTDTYWPDFTGQDLISAIEDYQKRDRRYGNV
ncbi:isoprenyl transferase [Serpentinicella alkaliphila]|uniref:Isoprenyl transferase n=1 Tax=Serpentinicella alkaliphila TaxID=1734049 RepID=A0A4R2TSL7_9FIRM|nr:isoprenyl transferase [Serpentinicella alkaliphila]QUH26317.1 isoprenyl transferase [Serpentinicella alkaliphila]TCQ05897.1 undecaprenyl diphosphate synthase [Serpentinicella alkaliphila]